MISCQSQKEILDFLFQKKKISKGLIGSGTLARDLGGLTI
jgi:hypothetical protein